MTEDRRQMTNGVVRGRRFFVLGLLSLVICLWSAVCGLWSNFSSAEEVRQLCVHEACFTVEIADTPGKKMRGLMFRESMRRDDGMLFMFDEDAPYAFWMKNTLIPLDIIWMDKDMQVVHIEEKVQPCKNDPCPSYASLIPARYVLELNAGMSAEIGLKVGDQFSFAKIDRWGVSP